jgi:hypothetical protein
MLRRFNDKRVERARRCHIGISHFARRKIARPKAIADCGDG